MASVSEYVSFTNQLQVVEPGTALLRFLTSMATVRMATRLSAMGRRSMDGPDEEVIATGIESSIAVHLLLRSPFSRGTLHAIVRAEKECGRTRSQ